MPPCNSGTDSKILGHLAWSNNQLIITGAKLNSGKIYQTCVESNGKFKPLQY